ncbi:hypothetical protein FT663_00577 [Candidozyma haemuli var. vulneris]|uniref:DUF676 domain-containing protein n=1 Tax=Candidozyma haemuli TaxID=45357 RepID=A0A2V1B0C6_9ASCO|nr:hypothetical protein CXQ85_004050 [[Candida] haemuloni]KAF3993303.1 hypothetical protein FT662_00683 [[Candida] haemuloni var. vulneris]KAF3995359.1 hypothetical protein FT663_00577 [[Candida] haemuloni var. vulneris]PVH23757.1 hypothetical protein CXQ85_004050 [[Candida] haemuloni]
MPDYHLVVLVHGIWGNSSHMSYLADQIQRQSKAANASESVVVYKTGSHSGYKTYDGIDVNGKRVADEIFAETSRLNDSGSGKVTKVSVIGYSLGGLMSRYALGILYHHKYFEDVQPVHFVTFCTPHVGTNSISSSLSSKIFNLVAPYVLVYSGQQMFLNDKTAVVGNDDKLPLLVWMADSKSPFYKALARFQHRSLYGNAINDKRTSWYTTFISNVDPFNTMVNESLSAYNLEYIQGYDPNVIDFTKSISFSKIVKPNKQRVNPKRWAYKAFVWAKVLASLIVITPVYSIYLLSNAIWQRVQLNRRIRNFYKESPNSLAVLYDLVDNEKDLENGPTLTKKEFQDLEKPDSDHEETYFEAIEEKMHDRAEVFVDSIFKAVDSASYYDYHYSVAKKRSPLSRPSSEENLSSEEGKLLPKPGLVNLKGKEVKNDFKLNFNWKQEKIVEGLNTLQWDKYPVIIRNTKATHAAVIHRHNDPTFAEGKVVVRHFIEQVFRL